MARLVLQFRRDGEVFKLTDIRCKHADDNHLHLKKRRFELLVGRLDVLVEIETRGGYLACNDRSQFHLAWVNVSDFVEYCESP